MNKIFGELLGIHDVDDLIICDFLTELYLFSDLSIFTIRDIVTKYTYLDNHLG